MFKCFRNRCSDPAGICRKQSGLCLQFVNVANDESYHAVFNVVLERTRSSIHGACGSQLPKGRFTVKKRSAFAKFWTTTGLGEPRRLSELYKCIGRLSNLYFTAELNNDSQKLVNASIQPINLTSAYLNTLIGGNEVANLRQASDKEVARVSDKNVRQPDATRTRDKGNATRLNLSGVEPHLQCVDKSVRVNDTTSQNTTGQRNYELSNKGRTDKDSTSPLLKRKPPQEQTNDEWLADYDKAG